MRDDQAIIPCCVEFAPGLISYRYVLKDDAGFEGERWYSNEVLRDQGGEGVPFIWIVSLCHLRTED